MSANNVKMHILRERVRYLGSAVMLVSQNGDENPELMKKSECVSDVKENSSQINIKRQFFAQNRAQPNIDG
jgi:hypothetical protein